MTSPARSHRALAALLVSLLWGGVAVWAQSIVIDPSKVSQQLTNYVLQKSKYGSLVQNGGINTGRLASQNTTYDQVGALTASNLAPVVTPDAITADHVAAQQALNSSLSPSNAAVAAQQSDLGGAAPTDTAATYASWAAQRQAAQVALSTRLSSLLAANNGKPLDWNSHYKVSNQLKAMQNQQLGLSMMEATQAREAENLMQSQQNALWDSERRAEARADASNVLSGGP